MQNKRPCVTAATIVGVLVGGALGYTALDSPCVGGFIGAALGGLVFSGLGLLVATRLKKGLIRRGDGPGATGPVLNHPRGHWPAEEGSESCEVVAADRPGRPGGGRCRRRP